MIPVVIERENSERSFFWQEAKNFFNKIGYISFVFIGKDEDSSK